MRHSTAGQTLLDMMKPCRSTEKVGEELLSTGGGGGAGGVGAAAVKFDIWEEAETDQGASCGPGQNREKSSPKKYPKHPQTPKDCFDQRLILVR